MKKCVDNKDNLNIYNYLFNDETGETDEFNVKLEDMSLKDELKIEKKEDDDDDFVFLGKNHLHPLDRLGRKNEKDDVVFVKKAPQHPA